ncbi:MAG TPA: type III pantothenate kinase [Candidatus Spyradocola merdavium]|nr:type III pantothenate kinase [Candidatus Spyradocola merdavium]
MILTLDVGNTNIKCALYEDEELKKAWRMSTDRHKTHDEYGVLLSMFLANAGFDKRDVEGVILSSVVPTINYTIEHMIDDYIGKTPIQVVPGIKTGINIRYDNPQALGADRICNAVAAQRYYGGPCIFIDFGTATTFGVISKKGEFLGGAICPGLKLSSEALTERAAQLPKVELVKPETVITRNTISNMQAGIVYGYVGQVDYIVRKMKSEIGGTEHIRVIATGGLSRMIASETSTIDIIDGLLTLKGLRLLYERNARA